MRMSEKIDAIAPALVRAQAKLPEVPRNHTGQVGQRKYPFADLGDIVKAIRPVLAQEGLSFVQSVGAGDGCVEISTTLIHADGQWIESDALRMYAGETAQAAGSAITYGKRYSLAAMLGIVTEDDDDGSAASQPRKAARPPDGKRAISDAQKKRMFAIAGERAGAIGVEGVTAETIVREVIGRLGWESTKQVTVAAYEKLCEQIEKWDGPATGGEF